MAHFFEEIVWAFRVSWRHVTGRWFIFRDVPLWFCIKAVGHPQWSEEALQECNLRMNRLQKLLEQLERTELHDTQRDNIKLQIDSELGNRTVRIKHSRTDM